MTQDRSAFFGAWRLLSIYGVVEGTDNRVMVEGSAWQGLGVFDPGGRMMALLTACGRTRTEADAALAGLFRSMIAYTGKWRVEDDKLITKVDMAWDPNWVS